MANAGMPDLPRFDGHSDPSSLGIRWEKWLKRFEGAMIGFNITSPKRKRALLFHYGGEELSNIFETLEDTGDEKDYERAKAKLTAHFGPKSNPIYETLLFRELKQEDGETIDQFCTRLRQEAPKCDFANLDRELQVQILGGCRSKLLRRRAMEKTRTLTELLDLARSLELSEKRASNVESRPSNVTNSAGVNKMSAKPRTKPAKHRDSKRKAQNKPNENNNKTGKTCNRCGYEYPHDKACPAQGKTCSKCGGSNHFARACYSSKRQGQGQSGSNKGSNKGNFGNVNTKDNDQNDSESDGLFAINSVKSSQPRGTTVYIEGVPLKMLVDSGCSHNIIDNQAWQQLKLKTKCTLSKTDLRLYPYGCGEPIKLLGKFTALIESNKRMVTSVIYVAKCDSGSLLGRETAVNLELLTLKPESPSVNNVTPDPTTNEYQGKYPKLFAARIGKLNDRQIDLHIDKSVPPKAQRYRNTPFHVRKKVEQQLKDLQEQDIIEDATGPTPWVSPIHVVPKPNDPGNIRMCVDMRAANQAIIRERHESPTVEELIAELNGSQFFSKLDLRSGYHQLEISPESRYITTFATHVGLKRFKRLSFGISSASEVFQNTIRQTIEGIPNVLNISDDILVHGRNLSEHNAALDALLSRLSDKGLTLNANKCEFQKTKIQFFGLVFSADGVSPDERKVDAIKNAPRPQSVEEVRSLLGMASYSARFIPRLSTITHPLRVLTETDFIWTDEQENAYCELQDSLSKEAVGAYFDTNKETVLVVDASPVGLGAMLTQVDSEGNSQVVSYASYALKPHEQRYSQIEREALAKLLHGA